MKERKQRENVCSEPGPGVQIKTILMTELGRFFLVKSNANVLKTVYVAVMQ